MVIKRTNNINNNNNNNKRSSTNSTTRASQPLARSSHLRPPSASPSLALKRESKKNIMGITTPQTATEEPPGVVGSAMGELILNVAPQEGRAMIGSDGITRTILLRWRFGGEKGLKVFFLCCWWDRVEWMLWIYGLWKPRDINTNMSGVAPCVAVTCCLPLSCLMFDWPSTQDYTSRHDLLRPLSGPPTAPVTSRKKSPPFRATGGPPLRVTSPSALRVRSRPRCQLCPVKNRKHLGSLLSVRNSVMSGQYHAFYFISQIEFVHHDLFSFLSMGGIAREFAYLFPRRSMLI